MIWLTTINDPKYIVGVDDMDRQVLLRKIMNAGDEIRRLEQDIIALQSIDIVSYPDNYSSLSHQAAINSEHITRKLRELVYRTTNKDWSELLEDSANELGITIDCNCDGSVDIIIPCLIPGRKKKPTEFITAPLYAALDGFTRGRPPKQPFERFGHCVIWITHVYDKTLLGRGRERDYDNIETKGIIDVINTFLLTDDNGFLCKIYNASEVSDGDFTRISVMKEDVFFKRILDMKNAKILDIKNE